MKDKVIQLMKQEIEKLEVTYNTEDFEKHLYALEQLIYVLKDSDSEPKVQMNDEKMIELMGGRQSSKEIESTNGDSIFDF